MNAKQAEALMAYINEYIVSHRLVGEQVDVFVQEGLKVAYQFAKITGNDGGASVLFKLSLDISRFGFDEVYSTFTLKE